jgi:glycosyltransferase involved in cell wall biosynthesis
VHLLVILRLGKAKALDKLQPLLRVPEVENITLVRHASIPVDSPKLKQVVHDVGLRDGGPSTSRAASIRNLLACFTSGWRIAQRDMPNAVIAFNLFPYGVIAWTIAHLCHRHVILSLIGSDFDRTLHVPILGRILRVVLKTSDSVVVFGEEPRDQLLKVGLKPDRVFVLPNTVNTNLFYPDASIAPDSDLIYVGNLHQFKRVDLLLRALPVVHQIRPETTLRIVGDGPVRETLENLAVELGIQWAVTFVGWSDNIPLYLRCSRILLLMSEHEGLPAAIIEALCSGLPVIATDVGAVSSIVRDGKNGFLLPVSPDVSQVTQCILRLLTDAETYNRMSENALITRESHSYEQAVRIWREILYRFN